MTSDDLPAVMAIERTLFPDDAWSEGVMRTELAGVPSRRHYLVARRAETAAASGDTHGTPEAGAPVGYAGLSMVPPEADVQTIAVLSEHQGNGVGSALLGALLEEATRRGCERVYLEVREDNPRARSMYEGFGFEVVGARPGYYQPSNTDALVMRCDDPVVKRRSTRG